MTVAIAYLDETGCSFVADRRVIAETGVVSDTFPKLVSLAQGRLTVAIAGDLGPAQVWLRAAAKHKVRDLESLLAEACGGDWNSLVYDAVAHVLVSTDGIGSSVQIATMYTIGSGADFVRGYLSAAAAVGADATGRLEWLGAAVSACSEHNLSVSRSCDAWYVPRQSRAKRVNRSARQSRRQRA